MLGDGTDSFGERVGAGSGGSFGSKLGWWVKQRAAQVLQVPDACAGHGEAAPATARPVEHRPDGG